MLVVPGKRESPLVSAWAGESVCLLDPSKREEDEEEGARVLHSVYGQPVTCLDVSACRAAVGVKSCGWGMNDGGNKVSGFTCTWGRLVCVVIRGPELHGHIIICVISQ